MDDRYAKLKDATIAAVTGGPGHVPAALRKAVATGAAPAKLAALVEKIRREPWRVSDEDIDALRGEHTEDEIFEIVVAAAVGAADERFAAAMGALEKA